MDCIYQQLLPHYLILLRQSLLIVIDLCPNCLTTFARNIACVHVDAPGKKRRRRKCSLLKPRGIT